MRNNRGVTLAELMVYLVVATLVIGYSLRAMQDMSVYYVKARQVTKMQSSGRDAISALARTIGNTGFKYYLKKDTVNSSGNDSVIYTFHPTPTSSDSLFLFASYTSSYIDGSSPLPNDSAASFIESQGATSDTLEIFRLQPLTADSIVAVERIKFFIDNDTLWHVSQKCTNYSLAGGNIDWQTPDTLAIIDNAKALQFQYSTNGINWIDDPTSAVIRNNMKYVKIDLLVISARPSGVNLPDDTISIGNISVIKDKKYYYRNYEMVVPIFNNGILR